jgi:hypothetical protein
VPAVRDGDSALDRPLTAPEPPSARHALFKLSGLTGAVVAMAGCTLRGLGPRLRSRGFFVSCRITRSVGSPPTSFRRGRAPARS